MNRVSLKRFALALLIVGAILGVMFRDSFSPNKVLFANDAPLGALSSAAADMKTGLFGFWMDLNWIGIEMPSALPNTAAGAWFLLGNSPVTFAKFHVPIALLALGLSFWVLLRTFGFHPAVCVIGAIAAALNMNIFSHAAWGLPSRAWTLASIFLALAAIRSGTVRHPILKAFLAGMAVSNAIMEGFDVGAIFSLYVAAYAIFSAFTQPGPIQGRLLRGVVRVTIVAVFAAFCAAAALVTLVGTQVKGVAGMEQTAEAREKRWTEATMWSLPKIETLRLLVPGLFGYRMDTEEGGYYWGAVGQSPGVIQSRHSGAGEYAGALVITLGALGIASSFRHKNPVWSDADRKTIKFFAAVALISLLFAWGRHAPFYKLVYSLPYFSTIRNPIKFMHPFHMAFLILFAYGLELLLRAYAREAAAQARGFKETFRSWWKSALVFDRRWTISTLAIVGASLLATLIYFSSQKDLEQHLAKVGFPPPYNSAIATFSISEAAVGVLMLAISVCLVIAAMTGWFSGSRVKILVLLVGTFLTIDIFRANLPWVKYYDYKEKYASNAVIDLLKQDSHLHRATAQYGAFERQYLVSDQTAELFTNIANEWHQHHFQFFNVQTLEVVQMPRRPELDIQYYVGLRAGANRSLAAVLRLWELSNTKYIFGDRNQIAAIGQRFDPGQMRLLHAFGAAPKPGVDPQKITSYDQLTWVLAENGPFGLFSYDRALPRVKLFSKWESVTDDTNTLTRLASPQFNPSETVLVQGEVPPPPSTPASTNESVQIVSYKPKHIQLETIADHPTVLLWNDKFTPNWKAFVDGQPATMLRGNFIMRAIPLAAGKHQVVMKYQPPITGLYFSAIGLLVGFGLLGFVAYDSRKAGS